jgi:hypothetical protein
MIIRRFVTALRQQNWATVAIEFLIVVAGIWVALQVENYNVGRQEQGTIELALEQMLIDLEQDRASLQVHHDKQEADIAYLNQVVRLNLQVISSDELISHLDEYFSFYGNNNSYVGLRDSGSFFAIKSKDVKSSIADYYETRYRVLDRAAEFAETFTNDNVVPFLLESIHTDDDRKVTAKGLRDLAQEQRFIELTKYQINVKTFCSNVLSRALEQNGALTLVVEGHLTELRRK